MTIVFAEKAHKSWPYTSVTNVSDELGNTGGRVIIIMEIQDKLFFSVIYSSFIFLVLVKVCLFSALQSFADFCSHL